MAASLFPKLPKDCLDKVFEGFLFPMENWTEQLISDVTDLDNKCYNTMPLTIIIRTDLDDNGERFFDATVFTGFNEADGDHIADVVGADSLVELFKELARDW